MEQVAKRIRALREQAQLPQAKIAELAKTNQSAINRYENAQSSPPLPLLRWYADYFDVSMDYIFGRTDKPQGKLYEYKPKLAANNPQLQKFIEMCFDPNSPMNDRLKQTLLDMLDGGGE